MEEIEGREMKLPLIPVRNDRIEGVVFNVVKEVETTRDGETLRTGGWYCNTVENPQELSNIRRTDSLRRQRNARRKSEKLRHV